MKTLLFAILCLASCGAAYAQYSDNGQAQYEAQQQQIMQDYQNQQIQAQQAQMEQQLQEQQQEINNQQTQYPVPVGGYQR